MSEIFGDTTTTPLNPDAFSGGGSGGGIVDQTYNPESANAQSGFAVAEAINNSLSACLTRTIVEQLPDVLEAKQNTIYMVKAQESTENNIYNEYMVVGEDAFKNELVMGGLNVDAFIYSNLNIVPKNGDIFEKCKCVSMSYVQSNGFVVVRFDKVYGGNLIGIEVIYSSESSTMLKEFYDACQHMYLSGCYTDITFASANKVDTLSWFSTSLSFELIGSTAVNLSDYVSKTQFNNAIGDIDTALDEIIALQESILGGE